MLNDCECVILATGPDRDITRIKHLLDSNANHRGCIPGKLPWECRELRGQVAMS